MQIRPAARDDRDEMVAADGAAAPDEALTPTASRSRRRRRTRSGVMGRLVTRTPIAWP